MLRGSVIELRLVRESDLENLYALMSNLDARGAYFPLGVMSEPCSELRSTRTDSGTTTKECS